MKTVVPLIIAFVLSTIGVSAQLPTFTQFSQNQLNINPAFAGYFDEDVKFDAIYRKQSYSNLITTSYYNAAIQLKPFKESIPEQDVLGLGFNMYSTKSLSVYSEQSASATISYLKGFDEEVNNSLSLGFQCRYNSKRIDYTQLLFPNQFDIIGYNFQIPNNEPVQAMNAMYVDINAGALYSSKNEDEEFTAGFSMYNMNQSNSTKSLLQNRPGITYMLHSGYSKYISDNSQIFFGLLYSTLKSQNATSLIASYGYSGLPEFQYLINFGAIYQVNNQVSPFVSLGTSNFKFLVTYDIPINSNIQSLKSNSLEFGFQYSFTKLSSDLSLVKRHISCFK